MRWTPEVVAGFARRAGFTGDNLVIATAIALATSGGDDAWQWRPNDGSAIDMRGLFGIDVARYPRVKERALFNAQVNADTANALWQESAYRWEPFRVYGSLIYAIELLPAGAAVINATTHQTLDTVPQLFGLPGINGPRLTALQQQTSKLAAAKHALALFG